MKFDKDKIKNNLTIEQVAELVTELGGEPRIYNDYIVCKTICHNVLGEGSHKLYYYDNTKLFRCFTECNETFDIFELVIKVKKLNETKDWELFQAIQYIAFFYGYVDGTYEIIDDKENLEDWDIFNKYDKIVALDTQKKKRVEMKFYDETILKYYPRPRIASWEQEGIKKNVMDECGICYNPVRHSIIIPHYDINNNLVGIRERTLIKENEEFGKYRPAVFKHKLHNHPLGFNLYNLNKSKNNIRSYQKAIILEGEKSCLQYRSFVGPDNDISIACCGSSITQYQIDLLLSLGVKEIVIGFDKQFKELGDDEWKKWTKKLTDIHNKYHTIVQISFLFDTENLLPYKASPTDLGFDIFKKLFNNRIML